MRRNSRGFSLIELLIVVAIILIIAAIAIPDLLKSRQAANQASAVGSLRTINTSEVTYSSTYTVGFSSSLSNLDGNAAIASTTTNAGLIDSVLGLGVKSTYGFWYVVNPPAPVVGVSTFAPPVVSGGAAAVPPATNVSYSINANPIAGAGNGNWYFGDQSGVIRMDNLVAAGPASAPLAG